MKTSPANGMVALQPSWKLPKSWFTTGKRGRSDSQQDAGAELRLQIWPGLLQRGRRVVSLISSREERAARQRGQIKRSSRRDVGAGPAEQAAGSRSGCARGAAPGGGPICRGCFRSDGAVPAARQGSLGELGVFGGIFFFFFPKSQPPQPASLGADQCDFCTVKLTFMGGNVCFQQIFFVFS